MDLARKNSGTTLSQIETFCSDYMKAKKDSIWKAASTTLGDFMKEAMAADDS